MLHLENTSLSLGAGAILDQCLHAVRSRHKGIDQIAVQRIGDRAKTPQRDAVRSLTLFKLQRKLAARPQPARQLSGRNAEGLPDGAYPPLWGTEDFSRSAIGLQSAIQLR